MARVAMPITFDQPPPLMRECRQKPSAARFGGTKGVAARVPIGVNATRAPVPVRSPNSAAGYPSQEDLARSLALLQLPTIDLDPLCPSPCAQCALPLGDHCYTADGKGNVHGECMAQLLLQRFQEDDEKRNQKDEHEKSERRKEFGIGWKHDSIPRNIGLQSKLKDAPKALEGMTCLVMDEDSKSVRLGATCEPLAAVNLEYLSIALKVRRKEGGEPLFSLDPVKPKAIGEEVSKGKEESQLKRFEPEWLAGTCVGEVLFQADYHLKELSMGECQQPIIGMKSCLDYLYCEDSKKSNQKWSGREWFMVRKAEVQMSEDGVLVPLVKMGVEAREQIYVGTEQNGTMIDAPITRNDHPMVQYADSFTKNFDLIAERSSVIFHLRELAKASVLAKYLVESGIQVDESWFHLAGAADEACSLEIPQLWNEKLHAKIRVKNGEILDHDKQVNTDGHAIYGGVQFGLDKFQLSKAPVVLPGGVPSVMISGGVSRIPIAGAAVKIPGVPTKLDALQLTRPAPKVPGLGAALVTDRFTMPGQLQAVSRLTPGIAPDLDRLLAITRPKLFVSRPPAALADLTQLAPRDLPSALNKFRVTPFAPEAATPQLSLGLVAEVTPGAPGVPGRPAPLTRAAPTTARRQLLAGGVLARQPIPTTVSTAAIGAPAARISTLEPTAISMAMPPLGGIAPGIAVARGPAGLLSGVLPAGAIGASISGVSVARAPQLGLSPISFAGVGAGLSSASLPSMPQGVDLNLNQFSLDTIDQTAEGTYMCEPESEVAATAMATAFWTSVDGDDVEAFEEKEDLTLFKNVFNPNLSDRRADGECFLTPDTSMGYINKLQSLVKEENEVRQKRRDHFFSTSFNYDSPGPLFPISWAPSLEVAGSQASEHVLSQGRSLVARTDYKNEAEDILKSASPAFHKKTEEGLSFRIYRVGSLEVRTTQEHDGSELVGAVFTVQAEAESPGKVGAARCARGGERIVKATEYVHKVQCDVNKDDLNSTGFRYYVVFETECGNTILSQHLVDGSVTWEENVNELDVHTGLAKVIRFAECNTGVTVQDMKMYCGQVLQHSQHLLSKNGQAYATSAYTVAVGVPNVCIRGA